MPAFFSIWTFLLRMSRRFLNLIQDDRKKVQNLGRCLALTFLLVMGQTCVSSAEDSKTPEMDPSGVTDVVHLEESDLRESSGLTVSNRPSSFFWTHNDSGGEARLYAFDRRGGKTGHVKLKSTDMNDWEDVAGFLDGDVPRLLVADTGDNDSKRSDVRLYLFEEPDPKKKTTLGSREVQTIRVTYPDGAQDCEAVAVDVVRKAIILVTKTKLPLCGVYTIPLPSIEQGTDDYATTAKRVTSLPIPMVTALDIDPINGDLWLVSYFQTFCFRCPDRGMHLQRQFSSLPEAYELPRWRQIEAVAIDPSHNVWVTSEGKHAPLGRLSPEALAGQRRP